MEKPDEVVLIEALSVTAELTGTDLSKPALRMMAADLSAYPLPQVLGALTKCRRELRGRLTIAAVIERLDDGRPGANEAWAMLPQDEYGSVVMTDEMAAAFGVCNPLLRDGQTIAARMAFLEAYQREVVTARTAGVPVRWFPSLGHDVGGRSAALDEAVRKGRITQKQALALLPGPDRDEAISNIKMISQRVGVVRIGKLPPVVS